jgi:hypothetical protein
LGGIRELFLSGGANAHRIGSPPHLFDDVNGRLLLRAFGSHRDLAIRPPFPHGGERPWAMAEPVSAASTPTAAAVPFGDEEYEFEG